ncbi:hypothetical protein [Halobaculum sp. D14]|uniref:hypothetical protein n=1 Tax=Halobaculum sp. D14 TaxID=3421642 RepID=UPI003EB8DFB4
MAVDIRNHDEVPPLEELEEFTLVPVSRDEIESRFDDGERIEEWNVAEERNDVYVELVPDPTDTPGADDDIGTVLYRLVQLFGTPQVPGFDAGSDVSDREDTTFKYLFRLVSTGDDGELPGEWLVTVHDWHTELGVSLAAWSGDDPDPAAYDDAVGIVSLGLVTNIVTEPVQCEYKDKWF